MRMISSSTTRVLATRVLQNGVGKVGVGGSKFGGAGVAGSAGATVSKNFRWMSSVINLSDLDATEKFKELNHKSVLYFTAKWCGPCKMIKPVYENMASKYTDVAFGKVDVDDNSDAALEYEINAVPTFVLFDGETAIERFMGADAGKLESLVKDLNDR